MAKKQRHSILCPRCGKLINFDETRCPYCGTSRPGSWWKSNVWTRGFRDPDQLSRAVIYVNIGMYVISLLVNPRGTGFGFNPFSILSPDSSSLLLVGATGTIPIDRLHRWWTLISASYLHGGILHIVFNMFAFSRLAPLVLQEFGPYRMFVLYTLGGIIGFFVSYLAGVPLTIGASAGLCSLMGGIIYFGKSRGGVYGQAIYRQIGGWAVGIFAFGLLMPGINNWAHGGGFLGGVALGFLLGYQERRRESLFHKVLAGMCAAATVVILAWAVTSGIYHRVLG